MAITLGRNFKLTIITPTALAADVNDYNPAGLNTASVLRLEASGADRTITGLAGVASGRIIVLTNIGSVRNVICAAESGLSSPANRFAAFVTLSPGSSVALFYDGSSSRWRTAWSR